MPARCSTSCLTLCHKHTLQHTLTPLLSSFHLLLYIINMESRNIGVNSSDTLIKAAKSMGLNWYSWRLSAPELLLHTFPAQMLDSRDYVCEVKAIKLFQQHRASFPASRRTTFSFLSEFLMGI